MSDESTKWDGRLELGTFEKDGKFYAFSIFDGEKRASKPYNTRAEARAHNERMAKTYAELCAKHGVRWRRSDIQ